MAISADFFVATDSEREKAHEMRQVGTRKTCQKRSAGQVRSGVVVEASK